MITNLASAQIRRRGTTNVPPGRYRVRSTMLVAGGRRVRLRAIGGNRQAELVLQPFALIGSGDILHLKKSTTESPHVSIVSGDDPKKQIPISPIYTRSVFKQVGGQKIHLVLREANDAADLAYLAELERFHYRSGNGHQDSKATVPATTRVGGRKATLLCFLNSGGVSRPIGYLEIQMPLLMCKPRHVLFDRNFQHPNVPVQWKHWGHREMAAHVNRICRIARVVVHPEFRGLGLGKVLVNEAIKYAKSRWHVGGHKPLFIEISAEMLKYSDFVTSAGLQFIGNTEGNFDRVHADMIAMRAGRVTSTGILDLQRRYLKRVVQAARALNITVPKVLKKIRSVSEAPEKLDRLPVNEWQALRSVFRAPIPYHMAGLDAYTTTWLKTAIKKCSLSREARRKPVKLAIESISISNLTVTVKYKPPLTPAVRTVMNAFGLNGSHFHGEIISSGDLVLRSGSITFVSGASGSGKTALLRGLDTQKAKPQYKFRIKRHASRQYRSAWPTEIRSERPLIDYLQTFGDTGRVITAMSMVGLAEAFLYLKPYHLLSRGQQYRARLARLVLANADVWLIDEFGADLDPLTAGIVATNLRKLVSTLGVAAVVAAANHAHFIQALMPDRVLTLTTGGHMKAMHGARFVEAELRRGRIPKI